MMQQMQPPQMQMGQRPPLLQRPFMAPARAIFDGCFVALLALMGCCDDFAAANEQILL
jgi:hypothetical protein